MEKLGFRFRDIKILLISHAHGDHCAGLAKAKEMTGAQVMVMDADVPAIEHPPTGRGAYPAVPVSRVLHDRDEVSLGGNKLTAYLTPGHTKGNTSWAFQTSEEGKSYNVVVIGSIGVNSASSLVNNATYPAIVEDYQKAFKVLKGLPCDIYLASHGKMYGLNEKYPKLEAGGANPVLIRLDTRPIFGCWNRRSITSWTGLCGRTSLHQLRAGGGGRCGLLRWRSGAGSAQRGRCRGVAGRARHLRCRPACRAFRLR